MHVVIPVEPLVWIALILHAKHLYLGAPQVNSSDCVSLFPLSASSHEFQDSITYAARFHFPPEFRYFAKLPKVQNQKNHNL